MAQISGLLQEKTSLVDNDLMAIDDSQATNRSRKVKFSTIWNYIIGKLTATASEINAVCAGNTATASEISQICAGRVAGSNSTNSIVTVGGTQQMLNKGLISPKFNEDTTEMVCLSRQLNTLSNTTGTGRVNEIQQGLAVGNPTITASGSYGYHGLVNINLSSDGSIAFGPVSSFNVSETIAIKNISKTATVDIDKISSDSFWYDGVGYGTITLKPGDAIALMAVGSEKWIVLGKTDVELT